MISRLQGLILKFKIAAVAILPLLFSSNIVLAQSNFRILESIPVETGISRSSTIATAEAWTESVKNAKHSIDIETFYIAEKDGSLLTGFIDELTNAAGRGVKIRIIVDSSFYAANDRSADMLEGVENIEIRKIPMRNLSGGVMHAKYFVVDKELVFIGSQNMDWRALEHIHEIGVMVNNKELAEAFSSVFETDWLLCEGNDYGLKSMKLNSFPNSENPVNINDANYGKIELYPAVSPYGMTMSGFDHELDELLKLIRNASRNLDIQLYSYSTKSKINGKFLALDSALRNAAGRGVNIRILMPDWATKPSAISDIKSLSAADSIEIRIISLPLHSGGFIPYARVDHCKYFVCDGGISWISTTNWEENYFYNSRNISLVVKNEGVTKDLRGVFELWWNSEYAEPVDIDKEYPEVKRN